MVPAAKDRAEKSVQVDAFDPQWLRSVAGNAEFLRLLEQMSAVIIEVDEANRIVYATPNIESISGYTAEELIGSPGQALVHEDDRGLLEELRKTPNARRSPVSYRSRHKAGHWNWIETSGSAHFKAQDGTTHSVSFSRDVGRLRQAEESVRESEERYRTVVESSDDVVVESRPTGEVVFVTENIERILGYTADEVADQHAFELVHPDDQERLRAEFAKAIEEREPARLIYRALHRDGTTRWLQSTGIGYSHASGESRFLNVTRDLTPAVVGVRRQRKLEARMQQAQRLESLGVMAGGVAHDFNNLLTPVLADASLALADLPASSPVRHRLERIQRTAQRAAELTTQMLAYAGADEIEIEPLELSTLVEDMSRLLEAGLGENVSLTYELAPQLPVVAGDPGQLTQVILNLLTNAVEALGPGGGAVAIRTGVIEQTSAVAAQFPEELAPGRYAFLEVEDDGCGMDRETRRRIFDPFFTTKFTGRGLGLASVLGILRAHGGAIEIDSQPGRGTRFRVLLSLADPSALGACEAPEGAAEPASACSTVLLIDDDDGTREVTSDCLERAGLRVLLARDGESGVKLFEQHVDDIAVVVLDRTMPGVSGEETFDRIRAIRPAVRILLISGYAEKRAAEAFAGKQLSGFIGKPFLPEELLAAVSRLVAQAQSSGEIPRG